MTSSSSSSSAMSKRYGCRCSFGVNDNANSYNNMQQTWIFTKNLFILIFSIQPGTSWPRANESLQTRTQRLLQLFVSSSSSSVAVVVCDDFSLNELNCLKAAVIFLRVSQFFFIKKNIVRRKYIALLFVKLRQEPVLLAIDNADEYCKHKRDNIFILH